MVGRALFLSIIFTYIPGQESVWQKIYTVF